MLLGDFGADVIKIEHPDLENDSRSTWSYPNYHGTSSIFASFNRNKRSITLDLKQIQGNEIFKKLRSTTDVIVEGFRPGVVDKYHIGYQDVKKINQIIIYCSLSGYGQYSPKNNKAGHDLNFVGQSGVLSLTGKIGNKPVLPGYFIADFSGSMMATVAILIAIINRTIENTSQYIDISLLDSIISLIGFSFVTGIAGGAFPQGNELLYNGKAAFYNMYETRDRRHLIVAAMERKFWNYFCVTLGREDLCNLHEDESKQEVLRKELAKVIKKKTLKHWLEIFNDVDACVSPVLALMHAFHPY
jgi:crotonobetainyl-CoA:carnitine CoA-transferase CaiB-like acyl-CoA transferase